VDLSRGGRAYHKTPPKATYTSVGGTVSSYGGKRKGDFPALLGDVCILRGGLFPSWKGKKGRRGEGAAFAERFLFKTPPLTGSVPGGGKKKTPPPPKHTPPPHQGRGRSLGKRKKNPGDLSHLPKDVSATEGGEGKRKGKASVKEWSVFTNVSSALRQLNPFASASRRGGLLQRPLS